MQKQLPAWLVISESLSDGIPVMLMYVLHSKGSSPGRQGFMMVVNGAGRMEGTIGGGIMEHKFVEWCREILATGKNENSIRLQIHDKAPAKNQSGMICSGEQTIFFYRVQPADMPAVNELIGILKMDGHGTLALSPSGISFSTQDIHNAVFGFSFKDEHSWSYREKTGFKSELYIIGGGHCSLALSRIMSSLDFSIHLYDHRKELNTFSENPYAQEKLIVDDYKELSSLIKPGNNVYIVIMTAGFRTDDLAFRAVMNMDVRFLGMLGSKKKIDKMFAEYRQEGIDAALLQNIHAPVGLQIHSQTTEEIAISIAAEIILEKNK